MRVIVFGATGGLGNWMWKAAVQAGHEVTAFVRSPEKLDSTAAGYADLHVVRGNVMNAEAVHAASVGREIAINCTSPAGGNSTIDLARAIVDTAEGAGVSTFYMVGGIGALWVPGTAQQVLVQDWDDAAAMTEYGLSPDMPQELIRKMTRGHLESMAFMKEKGVPHTFLCPGRMLDAPATAERVVTLDVLGGRRALQVNMGDVAQVVVDDLKTGALLGHRVCVAAS